MVLEEILVCPVCHGELPLEEIRKQGEGSCSSCGHTYTYRDGIYDLTPVPPPDDDVLEKWTLWEKLQENGLISYQMAPEASCSIAGREDVIAWKQFLNLRPESCVLDIGCGPLGAPEYLKGAVDPIGIDPLQPVIPLSGMAFVKAIGEYLPFKDSSFDSIILATSLDHVLSPQRVLSEVKRCLQPTGSVLLWLGQAAGTSLSLRFFKIGAFIVERAPFLRHLLWFKAKTEHTPDPLWQQVRRSLEVPPGAIDPYHFRALQQNLWVIFRNLR